MDTMKHERDSELRLLCLTSVITKIVNMCAQGRFATAIADGDFLWHEGTLRKFQELEADEARLACDQRTPAPPTQAAARCAPLRRPLVSGCRHPTKRPGLLLLPLEKQAPSKSKILCITAIP